MKIQLTKSMAGAQTFPAGSIIETTDDEARRLIAAGFAVPITEDPAPKAKAKSAKVEEVEDTTSRAFTERETTERRTRRKKVRK